MTQKSSLDLVMEFHRTYGCDINNAPEMADSKLHALRIDLLSEELGELVEALHNRDATSTLDALTDLQYVLDGAYISLGFWPVKQAALEEVHASNMSKLDESGQPIRREDGKILKGPNYFKPNLTQFISPGVY